MVVGRHFRRMRKRWRDVVQKNDQFRVSHESRGRRQVHGYQDPKYSLSFYWRSKSKMLTYKKSFFFYLNAAV